MKIGKYEFNDKEQVKEKIEDLGVDYDFEGNQYPTHNHTIVELGNIVLQKGEYEIKDGEMQMIKEPILSDKYHVDVIWSDLKDHPWGWKTYSCDLDTEGMHCFFGLSYLEYKIK
jgi:hypothetical protein